MAAYSFLPVTTAVYRILQGCSVLKVDNVVLQLYPVLCEYDSSLPLRGTAVPLCVYTHTDCIPALTVALIKI